MPRASGGDLKKEVESLKSGFTAVLKELEYLLCNLDEDNVMRAGSVYAENIDTTHAKIADAQIGDLSADKLKTGTLDASRINVVNLSADSITTGTLDADLVNVVNLSADSIETGTLDTELVTIASGDGRLVIYDTLIAMYDGSGTARLIMGLDTRQTIDGVNNPAYNTFRFDIADENGNMCIHFDSYGRAVFSGVIDTADDVNIGDRLKLMNAYNSGGVYFCNAAGSSMASVVCERFENGPGVNISAGQGLYINGEKVATQSYVRDLVTTLLAAAGGGGTT